MNDDDVDNDNNDDQCGIQPSPSSHMSPQGCLPLPLSFTPLTLKRLCNLNDKMSH